MNNKIQEKLREKYGENYVKALIFTSSAVQGDRATCLRSPDEVEFYYLLLPSSTALVRCALIDS